MKGSICGYFTRASCGETQVRQFTTCPPNYQPKDLKLWQILFPNTEFMSLGETLKPMSGQPAIRRVKDDSVVLSGSMDKFQLDSVRILEVDRIVALSILRIFLRPTIEYLDVPRNKKLAVKSVHICFRFRLEGNVVQSHPSPMKS